MLSKFEKISNCLRFSEFSRFANNHRALSSFERLNVLGSFDSFNFEFKIRITRIRVIEFSLIPIDLRLSLSLSLCTHLSNVFYTTNSKRFESLDGENVISKIESLWHPALRVRVGEKVGRAIKPEKVRPKTPLWRRHPRWLSKLHVLEFHLPNIFFQISKFTFIIPALSPLPCYFHSFFFLSSLSKHRKYFSTLVSLSIRRKIREIPTRQTDGRTERERERETTCSCSTWKCTSRLSGPNSPRYFHGTSPFLSVSLRQTLLKPREARSRRIHGGKRSNRAAFSGTRFENSVNWPFLN